MLYFQKILRKIRDLLDYISNKIAKALLRRITFFSSCLGNCFANNFWAEIQILWKSRVPWWWLCKKKKHWQNIYLRIWYNGIEYSYSHCLPIWYYVSEIRSTEQTSHKRFLIKFWEENLSLTFKIFAFLKTEPTWAFLFWKKKHWSEWFFL